MMEGDKYEGKSQDGFKSATEAAWEEAKRHGHEGGQTRRLRVAGMYIEASNPIHEFIVVLEPENP